MNRRPLKDGSDLKREYTRPEEKMFRQLVAWLAQIGENGELSVTIVKRDGRPIDMILMNARERIRLSSA